MTQQMFTKRPGELPTAETGDGSTMILASDDVPDTVRLPAELGSYVVPVTGWFFALCPVTGAVCRHLRLEDGVYVAESLERFYWYRLQVGQEARSCDL